MERKTSLHHLESILFDGVGETVFIYQIFYDDSSRRMLDSGFIPLDNTRNERPDWFEFWAIQKFFKSCPLRDNCWYGFLSPKFHLKTGFDSSQVIATVKESSSCADVILFSPYWDHLAYFLNPFVQGNICHPGLLDLAQHFFNDIGSSVDLASLVSHTLNSVFCNYVVAKPIFWKAWFKLVSQFFEYVETRRGDIAKETVYESHGLSPMKTFIQERLASVVLNDGRFRVASVDVFPDNISRFFLDCTQTRRMLRACDLLKQQYVATSDPGYINTFHKLRSAIPLTGTIYQGA